jgi:hypothetical protein
MKRWIDVDPLDWFYRDTLEISRLKTDETGDNNVVSGMSYNVFETGFERVVKRFVTIDGQKEFLVPKYTYHADNPMFVIVNGIEIIPEKVETGMVTLTNPLSAGIEVVCVAYGKPEIKKVGCVDSPYTGCSDFSLPSADLKYKSTYFFNMSFPPETCVVLGTKLKRVIVKVNAGEDADNKIRDVVDTDRDVFVIHKGKVYLPYQYDGFPAVIGYNATINGVNRRTQETVVVESNCVNLNDRFFPDVRLRRYEFFALMSRMVENLHNRYTDHKFEYNPTPTRSIADASGFSSRWYNSAILTLLNEKFHDGCYVFPLYADDKFEPEECITRAESVTYLHRMVEWITEKYR